MKSLLEKMILIGLVLSMLGCASPEKITVNSASQIAKREMNFNSQWKGRSYNDLIKNYGKPEVLLNTMGYRDQQSSLVVYSLAKAEESCMDTFTMVKDVNTGNWLVAEYSCT